MSAARIEVWPGSRGLNSALGYDAGSDRVLVVLSNFSPPAAIGVAEALVDLYRRRAADAPADPAGCDHS